MKIYTAANKQVWEMITTRLAGVVFSREENGIYYLKMPGKYATQLINLGLIQQIQEDGKNHQVV